MLRNCPVNYQFDGAKMPWHRRLSAQFSIGADAIIITAKQPKFPLLKLIVDYSGATQATIESK